jgi:hypothetical protein
VTSRSSITARKRLASTGSAQHEGILAGAGNGRRRRPGGEAVSASRRQSSKGGGPNTVSCLPVFAHNRVSGRSAMICARHSRRAQTRARPGHQ